MSATENADFRHRPFRAARWAPGPHAQTLGARTLRHARGPTMQRESWTTPDNDVLELDFGPDPAPDAPLALVLHGLEGSSRRRYVLSACRELVAHGIRPVALNFRGCTGVPNRQARMYHSGETQDASFVLSRLRAENPHRRVGAWGFSLGGNVLVKLLGEQHDGGAGLVDAAVAMSVPFDLAAGGRLLENTHMGHLYAAYFLRSLRRKVRAKEGMLRRLIDIPAALRARTLREFDEVATAPLHGFRDADHYYATCSSGPFVAELRVATLLLQSLDDPFLPSEAVPATAAYGNPHITALLTDQGGHVGFLEGSPRSPRLWGEEAGASFLAGALGARRA